MFNTKKNIYKSINKEIFKGFNRLYWFTYTKIKYFIITHFNKYKQKEFTISLLLPTRQRSKKFLRLVNSINNTCKFKKRLQILLLIDTDDNEKNLYKLITKKKKFKDLKFKIFIKDFDTHSKRNNFLAKKTNSEIIFPINDDMIFKSNFWDISIDNEFSKINGKPYCLWINSGQKYIYLHCDFPIINKQWFQKLGYVGSEFFKFWYLDTWICDLSRKSRRFLVSNSIKVHQYSENTYKEEIDNTHIKNLKNNIPQKDFIMWKKTEINRKLDSVKLL